MTASLLLFTRPADDPGAKSRLRSDIPQFLVNALHRAFVTDSLLLLSNFPETNRYIAWSKMPEANSAIHLPTEDTTIFLQQGSHFGERFNHALQKTLETKNSSGTIIMGSDTPFLTDKLLAQAITCVESGRSVLGPSTKNGFYLLGIPAEMLRSLDFSKDFLMPETETERICAKLPDICLLSALYDIDTPEDYQRLVEDLKLKKMKAGPNLSNFVLERDQYLKVRNAHRIR